MFEIPVSRLENSLRTMIARSERRFRSLISWTNGPNPQGHAQKTEKRQGHCGLFVRREGLPVDRPVTWQAQISQRSGGHVDPDWHV